MSRLATSGRGTYDDVGLLVAGDRYSASPQIPNVGARVVARDRYTPFPHSDDLTFGWRQAA